MHAGGRGGTLMAGLGVSSLRAGSLAPVSGTLVPVYPRGRTTAGRVCEFIRINVCRGLIQGGSKAAGAVFSVLAGKGPRCRANGGINA